MAKIQEDCSVAGDGRISDSVKWVKKKLNHLNRKITVHPLQAPLRSVDKDKPFVDPTTCKDGLCNFNHRNCHLFLEKSHVALHCPIATK